MRFENVLALSNSFNIMRTLCLPSHTFHTSLHMHDRPAQKHMPRLLIHMCWFKGHGDACEAYIASFPGLQSPNTVEGLVKLLRRMMSGRCWVYIWVDVGWTLGGVALPVKCSPRHDNYCQSRHSIRDRCSTTEQSVVTFRISRSRLTDALKTSETCGL